MPELPDVRHDEAAALLAAALADGPGPRWLAPEEVARLLGCYGVPTAEWRLAGSPRRPARPPPSSAGQWPSRRSRPGWSTRPRPAPSASAWPAPRRSRPRPPRWPRRSPPRVHGGRVPGPADGRRRGGAAGRRRPRRLVRSGDRLRGGRHGGGAPQGRGRPHHPADRPGRGRDGPLTGHLPAAGRLPRRPQGRRGRSRGPAAADQRLGRGPPDHRRAGLQPGQGATDGVVVVDARVRVERPAHHRPLPPAADSHLRWPGAGLMVPGG